MQTRRASAMMGRSVMQRAHRLRTIRERGQFGGSLLRADEGGEADEEPHESKKDAQIGGAVRNLRMEDVLHGIRLVCI